MTRYGQGHADSLGLSTASLPLLRDIIHERLGLFYDDARFGTIADRLAPLVIERGFGSFLDYFYLLKYDEAAAGEWTRVMDALVGSRNLLLAGDRPDPGDRQARRPGVAADASVHAAAHLERPLRQRRGAADDRDGARGGRAVRPRAHHHSRQRREPRRRSRGHAPGDTASAPFARCRCICGTSTSARTATPGSRCRRCGRG